MHIIEHLVVKRVKCLNMSGAFCPEIHHEIVVVPLLSALSLREVMMDTQYSGPPDPWPWVATSAPPPLSSLLGPHGLHVGMDIQLMEVHHSKVLVVDGM